MRNAKKWILTLVIVSVIGGVIGFFSHLLFGKNAQPFTSILIVVINAFVIKAIWDDKSDEKPLEDVLASYGERVSAPKAGTERNNDESTFDEREERIRISKLYDESLKNKSE